MIEIGLLLLSLGIILTGAEIFTNGIEWLGKKLNLEEGAVGSILAAVGTALPETMIPVIAILFGGKEAGEEIGVGAILGAPFMLSTLAFFISGLAVIIYRKRRPGFPRMRIDTKVMSRDLGFFLVVYTLAIAASFLQTHYLKSIVAIGLVGAYGGYVYLTLRGHGAQSEEHQLNPLLLARKIAAPGLGIIGVQVGIALGLIVLGAHFFIDSVGFIATSMGVPPFILALIIAPVATELPEKFNSVVWLGKGKDTLAMGNITGAMVFQSSLIPALGILLTDWVLTTGALLSAGLAIGSAGAVWYQIVARKYLTPYTLMIGGGFYTIFIILVVSGIIH